MDRTSLMTDRYNEVQGKANQRKGDMVWGYCAI